LIFFYFVFFLCLLALSVDDNFIQIAQLLEV